MFKSGGWLRAFIFVLVSTIVVVSLFFRTGEILAQGGSCGSTTVTDAQVASCQPIGFGQYSCSYSGGGTHTQNCYNQGGGCNATYVVSSYCTGLPSSCSVITDTGLASCGGGGSTPTPTPTSGPTPTPPSGSGGCDAGCSSSADCTSGLSCQSRGGNNVCWGNACEPPPPPSSLCSVGVLPNPVNVSKGGTKIIFVGVTEYVPSSYNNIRFTIDFPDIATVAPAIDVFDPYTSTVTGVDKGWVPLGVSAYKGTSWACSTPAVVWVIVSLPQSWWQVEGGATAVGGGITSNLPAGKNLDAGTLPGVVALNGNLTLGSGGISSAAYNWSVNAPSSASLWTDNGYAAIKSRILTNVAPKEISGASIGTTDITTGTLVNGAYYFIKTSGDLDINTLAAGANRVVIIVNDNVDIEGNISLTDNAGFVMILAGGNINVDSDVGTRGDPSVGTRAPELEGIFVANDVFYTGSSTTKTLRVEGVVAAGQRIDFGRVPSVTTYPGEYFKFRPDLVSLIPINVLGQSTKWQELAP